MPLCVEGFTPQTAGRSQANLPSWFDLAFGTGLTTSGTQTRGLVHGSEYVVSTASEGSDR